MTTNYPARLFACALAIAACDADAPRNAPRAATEIVADDDGPASPPAPLSRAAGPREHAAAAMPRPVMPGAKQAFGKVAELVSTQYVGGALSEDELWTGATEGVLARLAQLEGHHVNVLMSPSEHDELVIGTKGKLLGVGIMIERVADVVVIKDVIPGGPAELAGLRRGDRILGIDGVRVRELELAEVVQRIRGEEGSAVALFVQRDTEEWTAELTRAKVHVPSVQAATLGDGLGYVRISSFAQDTATELDAQLGELRSAGITRVVLDLRHCPGGLLDATVGIAERFLPPGKTVMTIEHRGGDTETVATATERGGGSFALAVLVGPDTASSAEILADALRHHGRATLVGDTTLGKRTVESIHPLDGGWALKLSVSRFVTASGTAADHGGVRPDVRIPADPAAKPARIDALQPDDDATLAAAMELLDRG